MPTSDWGYKPSTGYGLPQHPPGKGPNDSPITPYNFGDQRPVTYVPTNYPVGSVPTLGTVIGPPSELPTFTPDYIANHPNTNKPTTTTKPTGSISFSFGGGGGGGASVPSNVLNTRTFPPYESTWTPPAAVTPEPYNWATRDPYIYGEGLSNAGAAYDIWGSAPGTNPYVMTVPSSYTQGLLGMPPVQLPSNVPSTNVSATLPDLSRDKEKDPRITLGYDNRKDYVGFDDSYTGAKHGARKPGGGNPYPPIIETNAEYNKRMKAIQAANQIKMDAYKLADQKSKQARVAVANEKAYEAAAGIRQPPVTEQVKIIAAINNSKKSTMGTTKETYKMSYNPNTGRGGF